jgi:hypothetical protein
VWGLFFKKLFARKKLLILAPGERRAKITTGNSKLPRSVYLSSGRVPRPPTEIPVVDPNRSMDESYLPQIVGPRDQWDVYVGGFWRDAQAKGVFHFPWANPYWSTFRGATNDHTPDEAIRLYEKHIRDRPDLWHRLDELRGKRLACWCKPNEPACHSVVLCKLVAEREAQKRLAAGKVLRRRETHASSQDSEFRFASPATDETSVEPMKTCETDVAGCSALEAIVSFSEDVQTLLRWRSEGNDAVRELISGVRGILLARRALGSGYRWLIPGQAQQDITDQEQRVVGAYSGPTPGRLLSEDESVKDRKILGSDNAFQPADWWCDVWILGESLEMPPLEVTWVRGETDRSWAVRSSVHGAWFHEFTASAPTARSDSLSSLLMDPPPHCDPYRAFSHYSSELADRYAKVLPIPEARANLFGADGYRLLCGTEGFEGDQEVVLGGFYCFVVRPVLICNRPDDPARTVSCTVGRSRPEHFRLGWLVEKTKLVCDATELDPRFRFVLAMALLER